MRLTAYALELEGLPKPDELSNWICDLLHGAGEAPPPAGRISPDDETVRPPGARANEESHAEKETVPARRIS